MSGAGAIRARAAVLREAHGSFSVEELALEPPRADEILVRLVATGMCHTDVAVRERLLPTPLPVVLGHEGAGVVTAVGSAVTRVTPGDNVVLTYLSCGACRECLSGWPASCASSGALCFGGRRSDGSHALHAASGETINDRFFGQSSFATHAVAHERNVVPVRKDAPLELLGPLGCGIMTGAGTVWNELEVRPGSSLAVFGAGAVGLSAVMAAHVAGVRTVVAVDRVASRLALARELGATHTVDVRAADPVSEIRAATGTGVDYAIDTTGRLAVIRSAVQALRQRGSAALVSVLEPGDLLLDPLDLLTGCKSVRGVIQGGGSAHILIPRIIDLFMSGRFPFDRLVRFYPLEEINAAAAAGTSGEVIKPILRHVIKD